MSSPVLRSLIPVTGLIAVVAMLGTPPAEARCDQPALISTFETSTIYSYIRTPGVDPVPDGSSSMTASASGAFWALGFGDPVVGRGLDNGAFSVRRWLDLPAGYPAYILTTWAADIRIDGCIDDATTDPDCTAILLTDDDGVGTTWFKLMTASETETRDYLFNLPDNAPIVLAQIPGADVSDFDGSTATVASPALPADGFQLDPACAQNHPEDVVVGYKIYAYRQVPDGPVPTSRTPATDPAILAGWWPAVGGVTPEGTPLPLGAPAQVEIGCQPWDIYLAIQLVFDSGYEATYLSAPGDVFPSCECAGPDDDGDGYCVGVGGIYEDCDDTLATVFPGAPALCDDLNNDCLDPDWPALPGSELDGDGDGFTACEDCDDGDATVYPDAPEICDGIANRCGGGLPDDEIDYDNDGFFECEGDCAPNTATVYPGAPEVCDNRNNDCNHPRWPDLAGSEHTDNDGDGISECQGDCWDFLTYGDASGADIYPGAPEICDGVANDCDDPNWPDPVIEEEDGDNDGDGFTVCSGGDCDDRFDAVYPGAPEICDGLNNDCNHPDWPDATDEESDRDGDGFAQCEGDCADSDPDTYPDAPEVCDGVNNDCDDPNWPAPPPEEQDNDGDGFVFCADCDDAVAETYPGAPQLCDGANNDCLDPNWPVVDVVEHDLDADGFFGCAECDDGDATTYPDAPQLCGDGVNNDCRDDSWPLLDGTNEDDLDDDGVTECDGDCAPLDHLVYPGAPEICDGLNNDCADPNWPTPPEDEVDGDGDDSPACADCDDADSRVFPGAPQFCDGVNNDCDDSNWPEVDPTERDGDSDGFIACAECDDTDPAVYPGAPEICDGVNNDCLDPNWPLPADEEADNDGDGLSSCDGDCNDNDVATFPGAPQVCDGINNDCDDPNWPVPPEDEVDGDGDGSPTCADCDDADPRVYPLAPQACDGINNDCLDPNFPNLEGTNEFDDDEDGFTECDGDCADGDPERNPGAEENCENGIDDDCDGLVDYFDTADCHDLFVELESFTATAESGGVRLRWTTSREIDSAGFLVLRSRGGRRIETITPRPIPSKGDALNGAEYEFLDTDRQDVDSVRYWLAEIDVRGVVTRFGPILVGRPATRRGGGG